MPSTLNMSFFAQASFQIKAVYTPKLRPPILLPLANELLPHLIWAPAAVHTAITSSAHEPCWRLGGVLVSAKTHRVLDGGLVLPIFGAAYAYCFQPIKTHENQKADFGGV